MKPVENISLMPRHLQVRNILIALGLGIIFIVSLFALNIEWSLGLEQLERAWRFISQLITIDFSQWDAVALAVLESMSVAILATILSAIAAFLISFIAATNLAWKPITWLIKGFVALIRAIPTII
jgi:phosphonate transport system permease protein